MKNMILRPAGGKRLFSLSLMWLMVLCAALSGVHAEEGTAPARVSYLGPAGTYTEQAAQLWFQGGEILQPLATVGEAVEDLIAGRAEYAVIPQENTLGGAVVAYLDALIAARDVHVAGEVILPISQTLMGVPGTVPADIRTVVSHAQGLTQSAAWRAEHLPDAAAEEMASTAAAASYVAEKQDKSIAAVAAPGAAALYGLEVLAENVQMTDTNRTRFYVLAKHGNEGTGQTRAVFIATCDASRIDDIIVGMHEAGLELVALHDRPEGSYLGRYHYVIETENPEGVSEEQIQAACAMDGVVWLGCFGVIGDNM